MSVATTETPTAERAAWLRRRRRGIGSSDMPAILGVSPFASPLDVYMSKVGDVEDGPDDEALEFGRDMEPVIAKRYQRATGRTVRDFQVEAESAEVPYLLATLDAVCTDGRLVEMKTASAGRDSQFGEAGSDEVPDHVLVQVHHQLLVTGEDAADVAVMLGGFRPEFRVYTVRRDPALCRLILDAAEEFWGMVLARNPPPFSGPSDIRHAPALYPDEGPTVPFGEAEAELWSRYVEYGRLAGEAERARAAIKTDLFNALGSASAGVFADGSRVARTLVTRREHTVEGSTYAQLRFIKQGK